MIWPDILSGNGWWVNNETQVFLIRNKGQMTLAINKVMAAECITRGHSTLFSWHVASWHFIISSRNTESAALSFWQHLTVNLSTLADSHGQALLANQGSKNLSQPQDICWFSLIHCIYSFVLNVNTGQSLDVLILNSAVTFRDGTVNWDCLLSCFYVDFARQFQIDVSKFGAKTIFCENTWWKTLVWNWRARTYDYEKGFGIIFDFLRFFNCSRIVWGQQLCLKTTTYAENCAKKTEKTESTWRSSFSSSSAALLWLNFSKCGSYFVGTFVLLTLAPHHKHVQKTFVSILLKCFFFHSLTRFINCIS